MKYLTVKEEALKHVQEEIIPNAELVWVTSRGTVLGYKDKRGNAYPYGRVGLGTELSRTLRRAIKELGPDAPKVQLWE